jgi:hypothetical protein
MQPPEIEKGGPHYKAAQDPHPFKAPVSQRHYRQDSQTASHGRLRLVYDADLKARVLERAAREVREHPPTLPLWSFRLSQHVRRGAYGFSEVWDLLEMAAIDGGATEAWTNRVLYRALADSTATDAEPLPLRVLAGGLH